MTPLNKSRKEFGNELNGENRRLLADHMREVAMSLPSIDYHLKQSDAELGIAPAPAVRSILRVVENGERAPQQQAVIDSNNSGLNQQAIQQEVAAAYDQSPSNVTPMQRMNNGQNYETYSQDIAA